MKTKECCMDQRGVAFVVALIILLVLTFIGFAAVSLTSYESRIAGNERLYNNAFYAGDGGIENFRGRVTTGEFVYLVATSGTYQIKIGDNTSNISYRRWQRSEGGIDYAVFFIRSEGIAPNFPTAGRVTIEAIVEAAMMLPEGYN